MLNHLSDIDRYNFLGLDVIHPGNFAELLIRFVLHMFVVLIMVRLLYFPVARRKDYLFSFILISSLVFLLCFLLESVELQLGFAFGLFAIFGILRYRTLAIPIKEMTYLFVLIGISVINALANNRTSWAELIFTNLALLFLVYGLERFWLVKRESSKQIVYERLDLIQPHRRVELIKDLEERTGLKISRVDLGRIDFLRGIARLVLYYHEDEIRVNQADEYDPVSADHAEDEDE
ncbi:MAG: DUF4956 domain-containing protein [Bacteroidales bacterium]|nr:DUF4956 domain-containing protein [Bacteroidales bacterium]